jgi:hypothetical protein
MVEVMDVTLSLVEVEKLVESLRTEDAELDDLPEEQNL